MHPVWGVDLGGTKIEGAILKDSSNPEVLHRLRVPTESEQGYDHILDQIELCIDQLKTASGLQPTTIGFGTPGGLDPKLQTMKNCNTVVLNGQPLKDDIETRLNIPIRLANDANCFAIAETKLGVVRDYFEDPEVVFGVIMGTGVGGGIVVRGELITGLQGIGGEWGHTFLDESGGDCYCGNVGCVEKIISGTAFQKYYESRSGVFRKGHDIVSRHKSGVDPIATETVDRLMYFFGKGIANVINVLDPVAVVLGGGLGNVDLLYSDGVEMVKKFVFNNRLDTTFLKPKLGDSAGVFGAALL